MLVRLRGFRRNTRLLDYVVLAVLLVSVALVAGCEPAPQYSLWGFTWESVDPLYYHFDTGAGDNTQLAFSAALADWNATSTPVNFQPSSDDFVVTLGEEDDPAANWDGITTVVQHDGWTFLQVEAVLNAHYTDSYPTLDRRAVACHELGHVLGLDEFDGEVLMNQQTAVRFFELGIYAPQQGDIDGVNAIVWVGAKRRGADETKNRSYRGSSGPYLVYWPGLAVCRLGWRPRAQCCSDGCELG